MENLKQRLTGIRNNLYDNMPTGKIDAFELIGVINAHLIELDNFIDNECEGYTQPSTESKCNKHIVINWAFFPEEKPSYGDEILVEYPPEQMTKKEVLIYGRYTDLMDGCKWALITPCL